MNDLWDYLMKSNELTVLDLIIIAVVAGAVTLIATPLFKKGWRFVVEKCKNAKKRLKDRSRFKKGILNIKDWERLQQKKKNGTLTKREAHALEIAERKQKENAKRMQEYVKKNHPNLPTLEDLKETERKMREYNDN